MIDKWVILLLLSWNTIDSLCDKTTIQKRRHRYSIDSYDSDTITLYPPSSPEEGCEMRLVVYFTTLALSPKYAWLPALLDSPAHRRLLAARSVHAKQTCQPPPRPVSLSGSAFPRPCGSVPCPFTSECHAKLWPAISMAPAGQSVIQWRKELGPKLLSGSSR